MYRSEVFRDIMVFPYGPVTETVRSLTKNRHTCNAEDWLNILTLSAFPARRPSLCLDFVVEFLSKFTHPSTYIAYWDVNEN